MYCVCMTRGLTGTMTYRALCWQHPRHPVMRWRACDFPGSTKNLAIPSAAFLSYFNKKAFFLLFLLSSKATSLSLIALSRLVSSWRWGDQTLLEWKSSHHHKTCLCHYEEGEGQGVTSDGSRHHCSVSAAQKSTTLPKRNRPWSRSATVVTL